MGNQIQTIKTTKHGLVIKSDSLKADWKGVRYKGKFYPWKKSFTLDKNVSRDISLMNGEVYIKKDHWTEYVDGYIGGEVGLFNQDSCYIINMTLGLLVFMMLVYQVLFL